MIINEDDYLAHYGTPRHSGRYPWGSGGETLPQHHASFLDYVEDMRRQGLSDPDIAKGMGISTTQLRAKKSIANNAKKQEQIATAERLKNTKGMSNVAAAKQMGIPESTFRSLLEPGARDRADILTSTASMLREQVAEKGMIDIGSGVENHLKVSKERLNTAATILKEEGYVVHTVPILQVGTGKETQMKVLAKPGTTQREVFDNRYQIKQIVPFSDDGGLTYGKIHSPIAVDPKRVSVRYGSEGGAETDGMIYVRPGVEDLSLGKARYAQVRVQVGDSHFLKGMAMYKDDLPRGTDLQFNTNAESTGNKLDAMKPLKSDPDFPFGAVVYQVLADQGTPKERVTSAMNLVNEEGNWGEWSKNLSSQVLSKQDPSLARAQLDKTYKNRKEELDEINSLTNPTVKKKLLETFADSTDSAAVQLKAHALPRQSTHVILPIDSMPPTQIYAPNYDNGETVVLIRFPHGGTFEIPELTVNNKHKEATRLLKDAKDAVGIHHSVAARLSGADFDGDTVLVIPNNTPGKIKHSPALEALKGFNPRIEYRGYEGMPKLTNDRKQQLMGDVSNLITDMTLQGAPHRDIAQAVRHSMVVIDAEKHNLDYKRSAIEHGISKLKQQYQRNSKSGKGASTLISRKKSVEHLPEMKPRPQAEGGPIDLLTGKKVFVETGRTKIAKNGERVPRTKGLNKLAITDDAHTLSSGTRMESIYADHSNKLKALANQARLDSLRTPRLEASPSAKKHYAAEVVQLNSKLDRVLKNRPLERQAQIIANAAVKAKRDANPNLEKDTIKKLKFKELERARQRVHGPDKVTKVKIEPREWDAIQAGAISDSKLSQILAKADLEQVRKLATPRAVLLMSPGNTHRAQSLLASGATRAEVARQLGVSLSTLDRAIADVKGD